MLRSECLQRTVSIAPSLLEATRTILSKIEAFRSSFMNITLRLAYVDHMVISSVGLGLYKAQRKENSFAYSGSLILCKFVER